MPVFWYHVAVLGYALCLCGMAAINFLFFRRPCPLPPEEEMPTVSVLVPARNEEAVIEACVLSLLNMDGPPCEVLVLDDRSTDDTLAILERLASAHPRLRVLSGAELPPGWCGKPHACQQMAQVATGEFLLLTDADCRFRTDALRQAMGAMRRSRADVVSLVPDLEVVGFWERLIIPIQYFIIFAFLPTPLVRLSPFPSLAAANGAFLFLARSTYFALGGHEAVKAELAEDVAFARHVKRQGHTLWYGDGSRTYSVRMYDGLASIWQGFSRNLFAAFGGNLFLLSTMVLLIICTFILPPFFAVYGWVNGRMWWSLPLATYALLACVRLGLTLRFQRDGAAFALLNPLAWGMVCALAVNSARLALSGAGTTWKGRVYKRGA